MKTLRTTSIAVLLCLVMATPAAADSTINLTLSSTNPVVNTPVTYTVTGQAEDHETYEVRIMHVNLPSANCGKARPTESSQVREVEVQGKASTLLSFEYSATLPTEDYTEVGTYAVCANVRGNSPIESLTSFTVLAAPAPTVPVVAPTPPPAPAASPVAPAPESAALVLAAPAVAATVPSAAQKLRTALAKCKKLKKHSKRVQCERSAKKEVRH